LKILGSQGVCARAVIGVDRDSAVFTYLDVGVNIRDAQMNRDVRGTFAAHLVFREALGVDGYLVGLITGAMEDEGTVLSRDGVLGCGCLQLNVGAHDRST
jgi:hypothetical protein